MALDPDAVQIAQGPGNWLTQVSVYNASTTTTISAASCVIIDTSNLITDSVTTVQPNLAVTLPGTTTPGVCLGITVTDVPPLGIGRAQFAGPIVTAQAYGTVTAGAYVTNCTVTSYTNRVQTAATAAQVTIGIPLSTVADAEYFPLMLTVAKNA